HAKRFAASLAAAARQQGAGQATADAAVTAGVEAYARRMRTYRDMPEIDIWYDATHVDSLLGYFESADRDQVSVYIERKRKRRVSRRAFTKLPGGADGRPRIPEAPPVRVAVSDEEQADIVGELL